MNLAKTLTSLILALILALLLGGCGSTPRSNYYMLTADAGGGPVGDGVALGVGPVSIPDYLETRKIVMNRSDHQLQLAEYDRWAEPLDAGVTRVVAVNLSLLMDTNQVQTFPWRRDAVPEYAVRISVIQFAAQGQEALLVAEWGITKPRDGESLSRGISRLTTAIAGAEPEQAAGAYSTLLLDLSKVIAEALRKDRQLAAAER